MAETDGTCEYVLDPDDPETWGGEKGEVSEAASFLDNNGVWSCPHKAEEGKNKCIFHLPIKEKDRKRVEDRFKSKVNDSEEQFDRQFIGAKFDAINLKDEYIEVQNKSPIYFSYSTFTSSVDFRSSTWDTELRFNNCYFGGEALFGGAIFNQGAVFGRAIFDERAFFKSTEFDEKANFGGVEFKGEFNLVLAECMNGAFLQIRNSERRHGSQKHILRIAQILESQNFSMKQFLTGPTSQMAFAFYPQHLLKILLSRVRL